MKAYEITEAESRKFIWIYPEADGSFAPCFGEPEPDRIALQINYVDPPTRERMLRRLIADGVMRRRAKGGIVLDEVVPGRERDRDRAYGALFIGGWSGVTEHHEPLAYSPDTLTAMMAKSVWFNKVLNAVVEGIDPFFVGNGNGSSAS